MDSVYRCMAGIDIHKKMLAVVVRRQQGEQTEYEARAFGTSQDQILHLAAWLGHYGVQEVAMESTAQYWRPVWYGLEAHVEKLHLSHPLQTRAPRGRKRDFRDARRLVDRLWSGDLGSSFVPGAEQRSWRWMSRTRVELREKIGVVRNQVEGLLEEGGIKLAAVVSDLFGASGWAMLQRIAAGETQVEALVAEARGKLRHKKEELQQALAGRLQPLYQKLLKQHLQQVQLLRQHIEEINGCLSEAMRYHLSTLQRLCQVPGINLYAAQELLAEIGPTADAFPSAEQFASWVGVCPGSQESAGISYSHRCAKGNRYLRRLLCQLAWAAIHTKDTFFAGLFARLLPKVQRQGAAWAVAHRLAKVVWLLLHEGVEYKEPGPARQNPKHLVGKFKRLLREFHRLNIDVRPLLDQTNPATSG
jgi:transposase